MFGDIIADEWSNKNREGAKTTRRRQKGRRALIILGQRRRFMRRRLRLASNRGCRGVADNHLGQSDTTRRRLLCAAGRRRADNRSRRRPIGSDWPRPDGGLRQAAALPLLPTAAFRVEAGISQALGPPAPRVHRERHQINYLPRILSSRCSRNLMTSRAVVYYKPSPPPPPQCGGPGGGV